MIYVQEVLYGKKILCCKNGKTPGIFETWDECKKSVDGYSGAVFKSFKTKDEALAFLGIESSSNSGIPIDVDGSIASDSSCATAYVDGSYNIATKEFGYGVVMFHNGEELHMSKSFSDAEMASMRNVAGEIFGSMAAMEYAVNHASPIFQFIMIIWESQNGVPENGKPTRKAQ